MVFKISKLGSIVIFFIGRQHCHLNSLIWQCFFFFLDKFECGSAFKIDYSRSVFIWEGSYLLFTFFCLAQLVNSNHYRNDRRKKLKRKLKYLNLKTFSSRLLLLRRRPTTAETFAYLKPVTNDHNGISLPGTEKRS